MDDRTLELLRKRVESERSGTFTPGYEPQQVAPDPNEGAVEKLRRRIEQRGVPAGVESNVRLPDPDAQATFRQSQEEGMGWEPPGLGRRALDRVFGLDVEDPLPWTRLGTTVVGGVAGGMAGGSVPGGPVAQGIGILAGGAAGTYMGAVAPETALQMAEDAGILPPGTREKYGLDDYEVGELAKGELLVDTFLAGGIATGRGIRRGISNLMTGAARAENRAITEAATRQGIAMTPVQVGDRTVARGFVSVFGSFPWLTSTLKNRAQNTMDQIQRAFDGVPARMGPLTTYGEAGATVLRNARHSVDVVNRRYETGMNDAIGRAQANRVRIEPRNTRNTLDDILRRFEGNRGPRGQRQGEIPPGQQGTLNTRLLPRDSRRLYDFVNTLSRTISDGNTLQALGPRQVETLFRTLDQNIVEAAGRSDTRTMQRWDAIRTALQTDMLTRASSDQGPQVAREFVEEMHHLDQEMTQSIMDLMGPAAARMGFEASPTGRTIIDTGGRPTQSMEGLAKTLLSDSSDGIIREVHRLSGPEGVGNLSRAFINDAVRKSFVEEGANVQRFDANSFANQLGLSDPSSGRYQQVAAMLELSPRAANGRPNLTMQDLQDLVIVARRASEANIPDVSTFIARRVALGGLQAGIRGALPIAAVSGASGAGAAIGGAGGAASAGVGLVGGLIMVLGIRGLSNVISNPRSARALHHVLNEEATYVARRTATLRSGLWAIEAMTKDGTISEAEALEREQALGMWLDDLDAEQKKGQN